MSYPDSRPLPQVAVARSMVPQVADPQLRAVIVQLCDCVDYLNAQIHKVADDAALTLEE